MKSFVRQYLDNAEKLLIKHLWFHVETIIFAVLINLLLLDHLRQRPIEVNAKSKESKSMRKTSERTHITDELKVCVVAASAKHCGVIHLRKSESERGRQEV